MTSVEAMKVMSEPIALDLTAVVKDCRPIAGGSWHLIVRIATPTHHDVLMDDVLVAFVCPVDPRDVEPGKLRRWIAQQAALTVAFPSLMAPLSGPNDK